MANASVAIVDFKKCSAIIESTAVAVALQKSIRISWKERNDLGLLGWAANVLYGSSGGSHEINIARKNEISAEINKLQSQFGTNMFGAIDKGPAGIQQYANNLSKIRNKAINDINSDFAQVAKDNKEVAAVYAKYGQRANTVLIGASALLAVVSGGTGVMLATSTASIGGVALGGGALQFFATGVGSGMAMNVAKNAHELQAAKAIAIDFGKDVAKTSANEAAGWLADKGFEKAASILAIASSPHGLAVEEAAKRARTLKGLVRLGSPFTKGATEALADAEAEVAKEAAKKMGPTVVANAAKVGVRGVPIVFAAYDLLNAYGDYEKNSKALGY